MNTIYEFGNGRKQATPSDDLIDVDIEDYEGGEQGPDPDSQDGSAESGLPMAGTDWTPAFEETGWTARKGRSMSGRRKVASKYEWEETTSYDESMGQEVPSETNLTILSENPDSEEFGYTIVTTVIDGSWSMIGVSQYGRELLALGKGGKSGAEDGIDRQIARMTGKGWTVVSKKRAVRKSASGFYDHGGGVVELGVHGGDNQVGNSYGRVFARQNADGTYDVVEVAYYAAVNSVMGDEADELIAADEVFVEEQTWEWKNIPSLDNYHDEEPYDITYRNDMLMTNVSLAEAERIAEEYARSLSSGGDYIASRKRSSRKRAAFMEWERDLGVSDGWMNATYGDDGTEYSVNIENVGGSYRWHLWAESESGMDMLESGSESSLDAAKSSSEAAAKRWMDEAKYASRRRSTRKRAEVDFDKPEVQPGSGAADVAGTHTPGQSEADYPQPSASQETAAEGWPVGLTPAESARLRRFRSAVKAYTAKQELSRRRPARKRAAQMPFDIVAYMYKADIFQPEDIVEHMANNAAVPIHLWPQVLDGNLSAEEALDIIAADAGIDRENESSFDSDDFPKVVFRDQYEDYEYYSNNRESRRRASRKTAEYNGWANHATWNVALWINNDEGLYRMAQDYTDYDSFVEGLREFGMTETPDGVSLTDPSLDIAELDDMFAELRSEGRRRGSRGGRRPFAGSRGGHPRRGTRNRIRQMGAAKFDTSEYINSHGKPPRGRGGWAFSPTDGGGSLPQDRGLSVDRGYDGDIVWASGSKTLNDAKREVAAAYPEVNMWTVLS